MSTSKPRYSVCQGTGVILSKTKNGHPQAEISVRIVEGPRKGEDVIVYQNLKVGNTVGREILAQNLRALGMTNEDINNPVGLGSTKANLQEKFEHYKGKASWKARGIYAIEPPISLGGTEADELGAEMMALFASKPAIEVGAHNKGLDSLPEQAEAPEEVEEEEGDSDPFR